MHLQSLIDSHALMTATYSKREEKLNVWSHAIGIPFGMVASLLMIFKSEGREELASSLIFGICLVLLYTASTLYHAATNPTRRSKLRIFDHAAIFLLIAGTYTPFGLVSMKAGSGSVLLMVVWGIALGGIGLKIFFTGRFKLASTLLYVMMGWVAVFFFRSLMESLSREAIFWIGMGGISYTVGAILYSIKKIPYNHAIFHCFVLAGSICHFVAVYVYVL